MARTARVVVDAASLAHGVGEVVGATRGFLRPSLPRLIDLVTRLGFDVESLDVVLPLAAVNVGPKSQERNARHSVDKWHEWSGDRAPLKGPTPRFHSGAFDGDREVGCDEAMAWVVLERSREIELDRDAVVLVVSSDSDLQALHEYAAPGTIAYAGSFRDTSREALVAAGVEFVAMGKNALRHLDPAQPYQDDLGCTHQRPSSLTPPVRDPAAFVGVRSVAVVDTYGMRNAAARAIGVARTPTIESVRSTLGALLLPAPTGVVSVIPDLSERHAHGLKPGLADAWRRRDAELDAVAEEHEVDDDPTTEARRGEIRLNPGGQHTVALVDPKIKRVSTSVVAEIWWMLRHLPAVEVVVLTEDPGVVWLLSVMSADDRFRRVTRIGLHVRRVRLLDEAKGNGSHPATVVLTESLAARLVGADGLDFGASLRTRLLDSVIDGTTWSVVALEPESGGLVVRPSEPVGDTAQVEVVLQPGKSVPVEGRLTWALNRMKKRTVERFTISLVADASMACAAPDVVVRAGRDSTTRRSARVVERDAARVAVDVDGDGVADHRLHAGHLSGAWGVGDTVTLVVEGSGANERLWLAGRATHGANESDPEWVVVDPLDPERCRSESGVTGKLVRSPGLPAAAGHCLALQLSDLPDPSWLVLSSPLGWSKTPSDRGAS
jgi:hypothetical protein